MTELRALFEKAVDEGKLESSGGVHPADKARLADDAYVQRFLAQHDGNMDMALQMMIDSCSWRSTFGANDISEANVNMDYLKEGLFYPRGKDVDGCTIFIFKSKKHTKGSRNFDDLARCLVYWFERLDKIDSCRQISVMFDMGGTGLSNMDMDFTRYIISLFKLYYPDFLNYILIYEMPWVLNAAFKIIKTLLPAKAVAKMKFVDKSSVSQFIPLDQAQKCWGGQDDYTYSFVSASFQPNDVSIKKVTFADPGSPDGDESSNMMKLNPHDTIVFKREGTDVSSNFVLTNTHTGNIAFKIKTTLPEKTKVWPSVGFLTPGKSETIKLSLMSSGQNHSTIMSKIKFLVVCTPINVASISLTELSELFKDTRALQIEQRRLRCSMSLNELVKNGNVVEESPQTTDNEKQIAVLNQMISSLKTSQESLDSQLKSLKTVQLVNVTLSALLLGLIIYFFLNFSQPTETFGEFCNRP